MINVNAHINLDFAIPFSSRWSKCLPSGFWWDLFERIEEKRWRGYQTLLKFFVGREGHKPNVTRRQDDFAVLPSGFWWDLFERIEEKRWRGYQTLLKFFVGREGDKPNVARRQDDFVRILQSKLPMVVSLMRRVSTQSNQ
ncbi:MAG: hypothetical protein DMG47_13420 [Acidobacteria bacterium]|nr:MAG: hypothetical protein DMG47_13420 [Acidobacteriota bacterium]